MRTFKEMVLFQGTRCIVKEFLSSKGTSQKGLFNRADESFKETIQKERLSAWKG
jgi:hypothetical protein